MRPVTMLALSLVACAACTETRVFEIDMAQAAPFDWDGRIHVTKARTKALNPFISADWHVTDVRMQSKEGRVVHLDLNGYRDFPTAVVSLEAPEGAQLLGVRGGPIEELRCVTIIDPDIAARLRLATRPADELRPEELRTRLVPNDQHPFIKHLDDLTLADWWAIALTDAAQVRMHFDLPHEGLVIFIQGEPGKYGPAILEVQDSSGRVLRRFERRQLDAFPRPD